MIWDVLSLFLAYVVFSIAMKAFYSADEDDPEW